MARPARQYSRRALSRGVRIVQKVKPLGLFARRELIEVARQRYLESADPDNVKTSVNTLRGQ